MEILQYQKKSILNTVKRFYIYKEASVNNHLNDEHTIPSSKIFETILKDFHTHTEPINPPFRTQTLPRRTTVPYQIKTRPAPSHVTQKFPPAMELPILL
jgi:hypothetical protein